MLFRSPHDDDSEFDRVRDWDGGDELHVGEDDWELGGFVSFLVPLWKGTDEEQGSNL